MVKWVQGADEREKMKSTVDIRENEILKLDKELLQILLKDKTTGRNIIWATDNYLKYGEKYSFNSPITVDLITSRHGNVIKPRVEKSRQEQLQRVRQKAEVFTPSWICNMQNNLIDETWFGRKNVFNTEDEANKRWQPVTESITFPQDKTWQDYVSANRMEMTCGEAPYLVSRYDAVTGEYIEVPNRIGLLDRKLRVVSENCTDEEQWLKWGYHAVQSCYGFDWQGDNVLIARENIMFSVAEHYFHLFGKDLPPSDLVGLAKVIAWNIWQMDGHKFVIPNSCCTETKTEETLFETIVISTECEGCKKGNPLKHNGIYCKIKDWDTHRTIRFVDLLREEK